MLELVELVDDVEVLLVVEVVSVVVEVELVEDEVPTTSSGFGDRSRRRAVAYLTS